MKLLEKLSSSLVTEVKGRLAIAVRVIPNAKKNEITGRQGNSLKVRLTAPPVEGAANAALLTFLAEQFGVRKSSLEILSGHTSRDKVVAVPGLSREELEKRLGEYIIRNA